MISVHFHGKPFNIAAVQFYATASNAEEAEVEQDLLELTPKRDVLFIIGDYNAKEGSQEIPGVTGKFGLGVQHGAGQRLRVLPREHPGHNEQPHPTTEEMTLHIDNTEIRFIIFFAAKDGETLYSQKKQDWKLTMAQIMNSLLPNSDLT